MRSLLTENILKPLAAFILAAILANCNDGCGGTWISPADAYAMEVSGCVAKRDTMVMACAKEAGSLPEYQSCHEEAEDAYRICRGQVDRKYLNYNSNGNYPEPPPAPPGH